VAIQTGPKAEMMQASQRQSEKDAQPTIAVLEHLSGPSLGLETLLYSDQLDIGLNPDRLLTVKKARQDDISKTTDNLIARLVRTGATYRLKKFNGCSIWVNGRHFESGELINDDIIEFGEKGPLSRFRLIDSAAHSRRYFSEICEDCWDYIRTSRKPVASRMAHAVGDGVRRIAYETTLLFRASIVFALMVLGFVTYQQHKINVMQQAALTASQGQIKKFSQTLAQTRQEALTPSDLAQLRDNFKHDISASIGRLDALEKRSTATRTIINRSTPSVVFLQGAYGYRETSTGRVMRHVLSSDGRQLIGPTGPLLSLDGSGPPAGRHYTGTGFAIADGSILVTNRHVAVPWKSDGRTSEISDNGLEPFMIKLIAYSNGSVEARKVELLKASVDADLALLRITSGENKLVPLPIATVPVAPGDTVIVMGYPTGLRSMLARSGASFVEELQRSKKTGFWDVARGLSEKKFIKPLASLGIVAQLTTEFLVYDAATARGGSGGPVLDSSGEVVAVNAAILPEYGGSNLGVPARRLHELIAGAGVKLNASLDNQ
jgi:serine protease Do